MSDFQQLLAELNAAEEAEATLAKSMSAEDSADDESIEAAAEEGAEDEPKEGEDDASEDDKQPMAKSMTVGDEEFQIVDADQLIKSLGELTERVGAQESVLAKALQSTLGTIKSQGEMIKSLSARLDKLSGQGAGRKAVLTVHEKTSVTETLAKSQGAAATGDGMTPQEFFAKANDAFASKKITGKDLTMIDVCMREGKLGTLEQGLVSKVLS